MSTTIPGYGLWLLAAINAAFIIFFAWSFYKPLNARDWRSFGMFAAFVAALFVGYMDEVPRFLPRLRRAAKAPGMQQ